ncbi:hypothetical protein BZG36_03969 [Bifiguratus adelaidae]|uniref:Lysophospholipase n=1 Tax=Bifiguratus adelaidae TaxID=1938954 RepID=A0A261XXC1_9FUNG|nr:hypothetical protein BZG36_03969 [Bifiguratus adelaidae]
MLTDKDYDTKDAEGIIKSSQAGIEETSGEMMSKHRSFNEFARDMKAHLTELVFKDKQEEETMDQNTQEREIKHPDWHVFWELEGLGRAVKDNVTNSVKNPEILQTANLRTGNELCFEEELFLRKRKAFMKSKFAAYIGVPEEEVHEEDIPIIGAAGSGGGFRAMIAYGAYMAECEKAGLFDLITYYAGVSGACWGITQYFTIAECNHERLLKHYAHRFHESPGSFPSVDRLLKTKDAVENILGPLKEKGLAKVHLTAMDIYGALVTGCLLLPCSAEEGWVKSGNHALNPAHLKLSYQKRYMDGTQPMPIYTAVRHERLWKDWKDPNYKENKVVEDIDAKIKAGKDAWFQWFEFSPFEIGCDELHAWQPTWSWGRHFEQRQSIDNFPEQSLALLLGLWGSAPAGPMSAYLGTVDRNLPKGYIKTEVDKLAEVIAKEWGPKATEVFEDHHPIHAANNPNPYFHFNPPPNPPGVFNSPRIHLIDAGMDNNLPLYPLAHPSRKVDVIIAIDASSDVEKNSFFQRCMDFGTRKGFHWEPRTKDPNQQAKVTGLTNDSADSQDDAPKHPTAEYIRNTFKDRYVQVFDGKALHPPSNPDGAAIIGDFNTPQATADMALAYIPLLPNAIDPELDPCTAQFAGSYNMKWTQAQVEQMIRCIQANWKECAETVKVVVKDAWEKKRDARLKQEAQR